MPQSVLIILAGFGALFIAILFVMFVIALIDLGGSKGGKRG